MPLNMPTTTTSRVSFGPAVVFWGVIGTTPSTELGAIRTDDGVTLEVTSEKRDIAQGNPKLVEYTFVQAQGLVAKFTSIEWNLHTNLYRALGSGVTSTAGSDNKINWGGDPLVTQVALHIRHAMPVSGNTMNVYIWKAVSEAPPAIGFMHDEHAFELAFKAQRSGTDWSGATLDYRSQLFQIHQQA